MTNHDMLFKELFKASFEEFLELFMPDVLAGLDRGCEIRFLDKEIFTDISGGVSLEADLLALAKYKETKSLFLVHVEPQSSWKRDFPARMFYRYRHIQLNRQNWRDFADRPGIISAALICTMPIAAPDRVDVELRSWDMIQQLNLPKPLRLLVSAFIGTYLPLKSEEQMKSFKEKLRKRSREQQESVTEAVTCWERDAMRELLLKQLGARLGAIELEIQNRVRKLDSKEIDALSIEIFNIVTIEDLQRFLDRD